MEILKDFNLENIKFDKENQTLTFKFSDNCSRVCIGVHSTEDVSREIKKVLIQEFCS